MEHVSEFDSITDEHGRELVRELLKKCDEPQRKFFERVFPGGVDELKGDKIKTAYDLCKRTLKNNAEKTSAKDN